jgi:hypothetical protein
MYYRLLNSGFRLPATGGTDNFSNVWRDPSGGTARTYAKLEGPLEYDSWIESVKAGRTFATNGPLLFFEVEGRGPGEEIALEGDDPASMTAKFEVLSLAPVDKLEILVNGKVQTVRPNEGGTRMNVSVPVEVSGAGWIAARVIGPKHRYVGDNYAFAQTSPVYVTRDGRSFTSAEDAGFLLDVIDELWRRVQERARWRSEAEERAYREAVEKAKSVYERAIESARAGTW